MVNRLILESIDGEIVGEDEDFSVLTRSLAAIDGDCAKRELSFSIVAIDFYVKDCTQVIVLNFG
jgi:hypothetical protein